MLAFMWWMVIGLVAGAFARLLVPGRQRMGLLMTLFLGLAGSLVGGFLSSLVFSYDPADSRFHAGGMMMSTLGAFLLLALFVNVSNQKRLHN